MLRVTDLVKTYPSPAGPLQVLHGVSFELAAGDSMAIMGPSGCGKSTLLHILGTLDSPASGSVSLDGVDPFALDEPAQALFRNARVGFVFQDHSLLPQLTVLENVLTPLLVGSPDPAAPARARQLLDRVGLTPRIDHRPGQLSGGEKQRVAIARALIRKPQLLLCDEPTGNLDQRSADAAAALLRELQAEQQTILVVVTHSSEIASHFARRAILDNGILTSAGA